MVRIRPARLSDASTIADIQVETWRDIYAGLIPDRTLLGLSRTSHIENWRGILRDTRGHNITRVAEGPDACIVGFANAGRARPTNLPGGRAPRLRRSAPGRYPRPRPGDADAKGWRGRENITAPKPTAEQCSA